MELLRDRQFALMALAIPVFAGAIWMVLVGAPQNYVLTNLIALAIMSLWILIGRAPHTSLSRHLATGLLLLVMLYPLYSGPYLLSIAQDPVARWIAFGPVSLHSGMVAIPPLVLLAARNQKLTAPILLVALFVVSLQPDAASGFALTFAAIGIHHVTRDWKVGAACIIAFLASIVMALRGEIAPQPFVERVLVDAAADSFLFAILLALSLVASFLLILFPVHMARAPRFALAGALFGFAIMALMSSYPTPLISYGVAPIIGFGIALGLHRKEIK